MGIYQDRKFLILMDDSEEIILIKDTLKSPLGLAKDIIKFLFEEKFGELKDSIDEIKRFAAGINRAEKLSSYSLASYYPYMFAFQQYFHSSYRARQDMASEKLVQEISKYYKDFNGIQDKNKLILGSIIRIVKAIEDWDDLWISYAIASKELESIHLSGYSNSKLINDKYYIMDIKFDFCNYERLDDSISKILNMMIPSWKENSIPFHSPSDMIYYLRDLLYLRACYERI